MPQPFEGHAKRGTGFAPGSNPGKNSIPSWTWGLVTHGAIVEQSRTRTRQSDTTQMSQGGDQCCTAKPATRVDPTRFPSAKTEWRARCRRGFLPRVAISAGGTDAAPGTTSTLFAPRREPPAWRIDGALALRPRWAPRKHRILGGVGSTPQQGALELTYSVSKRGVCSGSESEGERKPMCVTAGETALGVQPPGETWASPQDTGREAHSKLLGSLTPGSQCRQRSKPGSTPGHLAAMNADGFDPWRDSWRDSARGGMAAGGVESRSARIEAWHSEALALWANGSRVSAKRDAGSSPAGAANCLEV